MKDYFKVISDPLSIKKLQKMVKGVHGRGDVSGNSDFKTWNAFEEKSKLLWTNAFFYNEEGSEIYAMAHELEVRILTSPGWVPLVLTCIRLSSARSSKRLKLPCRNLCSPRSS